MKISIFYLAITLLLAACANPVNLRTAQNYAHGCIDFQYQGEWWKARRACSRAEINAELGGANLQFISNLWYQYGRTSGVICDYLAAQSGLEQALATDKVNNGHHIMDYFELARLHFVQKKYQEASNYYQLGVASTSQSNIAQDPIGYANILDEYGETLKQIGDAAKSEKIIAESKQLRASNANIKSRSPRTPYGEFCDQKS